MIKDYTSETLDLTDPDTFRDLTKPMGAQNPERLQDFIKRYNVRWQWWWWWWWWWRLWSGSGLKGNSRNCLQCKHCIP